MNQQEIIDRLRNLMRKTSQEKVDWNAVNAASTIESLGFDSLSVLDLIYDIQSEFGIEFDAEEMAGVRTVGDLANFLEKKV